MKPFSLLIKPACGDCNLRCEYCFYLDRCSLYPETASHRMTDRVLEKVVQSFLATDQVCHSFAWQGGEPTLMGVEFFRRVTELQEKYGRSGQSVSNGLQTNGTLITDELAEHLHEKLFLLGVSLDGPAEVHDKFRRYGDGRGSHADVMKGIACLTRYQVDFNIMTLVSQANVRDPAGLYDYLCNKGFLFHQYIECVEFGPDGRLLPFAVSGPEWGDFLCGLFDAWVKHDTRRVSIRLFDSIVAKLVDGVSVSCPMATNCRQYLVVEHNGDIYPCDFHVQRDLKLGNIMERPWQDFLDHQVYHDFGARKSQWNDACAQCEYLALCAGDCPKNRPGGSSDPRQLSALCAGWKQFYKHTRAGFERLAQEIRNERTAEAAWRGAARQVMPPVPSGKSGRNEPCPCGSGLKYKKCCARV